MKHYFCTITFNNTTNKSLKEGSGMLFHVKVVANDYEDAKRVTELTAKKMWNNIFQNKTMLENAEVSSIDIDCGYSSVYPISSNPNFTIDVKEEELVSSWGDAHDDRLRNAINEIWANDDYRGCLRLIVRAYFERDCDELANFYSDECVYWKANELPFDEFLGICSFEELCYEMFTHILDDEDYRAIINFIRPKLSFVENWWEV